MPRQSVLAPQLKLDEIDAYKKDVDVSLRRYFTQRPPELEARLVGKTQSEVAIELRSRLEESDTRSTFFLLTSLEASFKIDFEFRCSKRLKDDLSTYFRDLQKERSDRTIRLDDDILEGWKIHAHAPPALISELRRAFKFRHWLAHGRYWTPKVGKLDFESVYSMALLVSTLPFEA
jgi:hypothetical protein